MRAGIADAPSGLMIMELVIIVSILLVAMLIEARPRPHNEDAETPRRR